MAVRAMDDVLSAHRAKTQRAHRVRNSAQLVALVDALGFCFAFSGEAAYPVPAAFDHLSTNDDGKKWEWMWPWKDELPEAKKLYIRQADVYAAYLAYTDSEIGRVIQAVADTAAGVASTQQADERSQGESLQTHGETRTSARTRWLSVSTTSRSPVFRSIASAVGAPKAACSS